MLPLSAPSACILIVDDDDDIRDLIASHLDRAGYKHVGAATLAEARAALARHDIALMLLDLTLPDGIRITAADPSFEAKMALSEKILREDRNILRVLAK
jgi:DNA-binding NtrC family response regulator